MISTNSFGLDAAGVDAISPFHWVLSRDGRVSQVGRSIERLVPELLGSDRLHDLIHVKGPAGPATYDHFHRLIGKLLVYELPTCGGLTVRAQVLTGPENSLLIIGTPWFTEMSAIAASGLSLSDFAPQDSVTDLLVMVQTQASSLQDATNMAEALSALNQQLESRVQQRTQALAEKTRALEQEIADRQRIEAELRLAQKLESVGQLAAGIAHEINTPIQFIGDNLRFVGDALKDLMAVMDGLDPVLAAAADGRCAMHEGLALRALTDKADLPYLKGELPKAVEQSLEGIERVASLVRALKEFSHPDRGEHKPTDLNHAIGNALIVAKNEYKYVADAVIRLDPALPPVTCNLGEINQVLLNLLVNAAHAIGDLSATKGRGTITVSSRRDGDMVELSVSDTGTGIPESAQAKIFDPFFTTKPVGKGTGQGLYLVHSIVTKKHHGTIAFTTQAGVGTTFTVRLPINPPATGG